MNASAGSMLVLQILIFGGVFLWWANLAGLVLAGAALMKARRPVVRTVAKWSLAAQLAPVALALLLLPVFFAELSFNAPIPDGLANILGSGALLVGPVMSIGLICIWVLSPKTTGTTTAVLVCGLLFASLVACGPSPATPSPDADAAPASPADVVLPMVEPTLPLSIEASCRQAVETLYGQSGTAVSFDASDFSVSWPAPVDGGRLRFACSVVGSQITLSNDRQTQTVDLTSPATSPGSGNTVGAN